MKRSLIGILLVLIVSCGVVGATGSLTIYQDNLGLVKQRVDIPPTAKGQNFSVTGMATQLLVDSVQLQLACGTSIARQWYVGEVTSYGALLKAYVGKEVLWRYEEQGESITKPVKLVRADSGFTVIQVEEELWVNPSGTILFPADTSPFHSAMYFEVSEDVAATTGSIAYLTRGLSWSVYYDLLLSEDEQQATLLGRAQLSNQSGASFTDVLVRLVAGELNTDSTAGVFNFAMETAMLARATAVPESQQFFEYYVYDLPAPVTLEQGARVFVPFMEQRDLTVEKSYILAQSNALDTTKRSIETWITLPVEDPVPAGLVRVYQGDGTLGDLIGETRIAHTSSGERLELKVGTPFDLDAEKVILDQSSATEVLGELRKTTNTYRIAITIENYKDQEVVVTVPQGLPWDNYEVTVESGHPMRKIEHRLVEFDVTVPAQGQAQLVYVVETVSIR